MTLNGTYGKQYSTGRELGRGGEGTVYELQSDAALVLKLYNEPLTADKISKLKLMVAMKTDAIEAYAAWPTDLVTNDTGTVCGFVMRKLFGYAPLHTVFSPMDRKKMFPDKGYNFLVHIARNLATAFHRLHEAGLVVGDVNEGNILINSQGFVSFIDCDSFQVKGDDDIYFCEVGIPRYTPPELLRKGTFDNVVRTANTDSFSMAVLIFQLLFMGRHPFAGVNKLSVDYDEPTAIRQHQFAYSLENKKKKIHPPQDAFSITNLPSGVVSLFHRAFEQDERPTPADWAKSLDALLGDMTTCFESRLHSYPAQLTECPWCYFKQRRGILYFLDDSYMHATAALGDVESFVNGFSPGNLELKKWSGSYHFPDARPAPIPPMFYRYKTIRIVVAIGLSALWFAMGLYLNVFVPGLVCGVIMFVLVMRGSGWSKKIKAELDLRVSTQRELRQKLDLMVSEHNHLANNTTYNNSVHILAKHVQDFRALPAEFERMKRLAEESIYNGQLHNYLSRFELEAYTIPSIGPAKKAALYANGIYNASDLSRLPQMRIPGIGPKNQQILIDWQRQHEGNFLYIPDNNKIALAMDQVNRDIGAAKMKLETAIRREYQSLNYQKQNITSKATFMARQITDLSLRSYQAELDLMLFRKFAP